MTKSALFPGKDYITTQEWADAEIETLLEVSADLKRKFKNRIPHRYLPDKPAFIAAVTRSERCAFPNLQCSRKALLYHLSFNL